MTPIPTIDEEVKSLICDFLSVLQGGSEVWNSKSQIASLAFHPVERLLAIATYNEIHFWDWSRSDPFTYVTTKTHKEKVR